jgi:hypothetical protein
MFVPAVVLAASSNVGSIDQKSSVSISRPYIVEEVSPSGQILSTQSGISSQVDPLLISQDLSANPYPEDKFSAFPDIKMNIGSKITLYRAPIYYLKDGKKNYTFRSWKKSVGELLIENKIELGQDDKINFSASTDLEEEMHIVINRVAITTVIEPEVINYQNIKKSNPNVEKGNKKTLQAGKNGTKNKFYLVTRQDGEEVSRKFTKSEIAEQSTDEIIEIGTKVVVYGSGVASIWKPSGDLIGACNFVSKGTKAHVVNVDNGKSVDITCMGGGLRSDRIVDLSDAVFIKLGGSWSQGLLKNVRVEKYYAE